VAPTIPRDHSSHQTYLEMHIAQGENFAPLETPFHKQEGYIEQPMQEKAAEPQVERAMVKGTDKNGFLLSADRNPNTPSN
jgi:hypothetical protein